MSTFVIRDDSNSVSCLYSWKLFVDGASRNNPGPSGAGIYIEKNGKSALKKGFFLGSKTNNEAEYLALVLGLFLVREHYKPGDTLTIVSDSELIVKQLRGEYRVRKEELKPLHGLAALLIREHNAKIMHVLRAYNKVADEMANQGIDQRVIVPIELVQELNRYGVTILAGTAVRK